MAYDNVRLRLESPNDSAAREYRVNNGIVETRRQTESRFAAEISWHRLTPQQLSDHVKRSDVVSKWLEYRIGWRRLLNMCVAEETHDWTSTHAEQHAEM